MDRFIWLFYVDSIGFFQQMSMGVVTALTQAIYSFYVQLRNELEPVLFALEPGDYYADAASLLCIAVYVVRKSLRAFTLYSASE